MDPRSVLFLGSSLEDLRAFPADARQDTGYALHLLQHGDWPPDTKPMRTVGSGVHEIRVSADGRAFRTLFVAKLDDAIYVLHAFEKKTRKTPQRDLDLARHRYRDLLRQRE
ncbi:MAG: type II toxin-antitoxin system RelE/ParE family toxin [Bacteroidota bacterium]